MSWHRDRRIRRSSAANMILAALAACSGETSSLQVQTVESCMLCHNGSLDDDYGGPGIENPHPFGAADSIRCTTCHGGNGNGNDQVTSHVPPPPQIGDEAFQTVNARAYFNRLTLTGIDKYPNYTVDGRNYTALDYLQFINPGDLRVTGQSRGCGQCHANHADVVGNSLLASEAGIISGAMYAIGAENFVPASQGLHEDTAADLAFRAVNDPGFSIPAADVGDVGQLLETPVFSRHGVTGGSNIFNNPAYHAAALNDDINADHTVVTNSPLANLYVEQIAFTCGDCHLGSAGANNRAGDFRSSGCTACHFPYAIDGRSQSTDPNVAMNEPLDPDDIDEPERSHPRTHQIASVYRSLPVGGTVAGIDDHACAGCHQGSNRTVMQYWGIRLDQNQDVRNNRQYPANPASRTFTTGDTRLFDPVANNQTFNGRNRFQYLLAEDYDNDGRDDTPADVHHEAGMGCIDCHGSYDLHGGDVSNPDGRIRSRMEQQVGVRCETCHGTIEAYASTVAGTAWDGSAAQLAVDAEGHALDHVVRTAPGEYWLRSRLTGALHYVPQTRDTVNNNGKTHPVSATPIYTANASYSMGRVDADPANGTGPVQTAGTFTNFSHTDRMDCVACHGAWTNTCMGCHLSGEYDTGNNFSNITGERIVFKQRTADFTYQSPIFFQLGVGPRGKITQFSANTKVFFQWEDGQSPPQLSQRFTFSDRNQAGNNASPNLGSLSHNAIMAHSIRGRVEPTKEGPRYCVACHLTTDSIGTWGTEYDAFRAAMAAGNYTALDFNLLRTHFGQNTGNQNDSPLWAHMAAGLGTGLFLFSDQGAPVNPIDTFAGRFGADGVAPSVAWPTAVASLNLDRIVEASGRANGSNNHAWVEGADGSALRDGALDTNMAGPLGATLIELLCDPVNGLVLDSWLDANAVSHGASAP